MVEFTEDSLPAISSIEPYFDMGLLKYFADIKGTGFEVDALNPDFPKVSFDNVDH